MTKMTDAFKKIFLGLGGDPKELAENNDVGDYILDLESAIKKTASDAVGEVINDDKSTLSTTYSSRKINSLISDSKKRLEIKYNGGGADNPVIVFPDDKPWYSFVFDTTSVRNSVIIFETNLDMTIDPSVPIEFMGSGVELTYISKSFGRFSQSLVYGGIVESSTAAPGETKSRFYELYCLIDMQASQKHKFVCKPIEFN